MSYIDYEVENFFGRVIEVRETIYKLTDWCAAYKRFRIKYPEWITKNKESIKIYDMTDSHLNNTIALLQIKDPCGGWLKAMRQEKTYREYAKRIKELTSELNKYEQVIDKCF